MQAEIVKLGLTYQLATSETSFVAVQRREQADQSEFLQSVSDYQLHRALSTARESERIGMQLMRDLDTQRNHIDRIQQVRTCDFTIA